MGIAGLWADCTLPSIENLPFFHYPRIPQRRKTDQLFTSFVWVHMEYFSNGFPTATLSGTVALLATGAAGSGSASDGRAYTGDAVNLTGTSSGPDAGNYSVVQPTGLMADITALPAPPVVVLPVIVAVIPLVVRNALTQPRLSVSSTQANNRPEALCLSNKIMVTQSFSSDSVANLIAAGGDLSTALPPTAAGPASSWESCNQDKKETTRRVGSRGVKLEIQTWKFTEKMLFYPN